MRVLENNSLKAEIEEILKLCKEAEEKGEGSSYFNEPVSEQEMNGWEETNGVKIPESYKEWLRFTGKCQIANNTATFYGPKEFSTEYVPEDLVVIGEMVGDGEVVCFSKETGEFVGFFEGDIDEEYNDFLGVLSEIKRMIKRRLGKRTESKEEEEKEIEMMLKKLEEIRRKRNER